MLLGPPPGGELILLGPEGSREADGRGGSVTFIARRAEEEAQTTVLPSGSPYFSRSNNELHLKRKFRALYGKKAMKVLGVGSMLRCYVSRK